QDAPRYLLVLGDADEVSWDLQLYLQHQAMVGRLAFAADEGYEAYVDKVVRAESKRADSLGRALFYVAPDHSAATSVGDRWLVQPNLAASLARARSGDFQAHEIRAVDAEDPDALLLDARKDGPTVLFTLSHGAGAPRAGWKSEEDRRR